MARWWNGNRRELAVTAPCCGTATDLNSLAYDWPQAFACCYVEVTNPGRMDTADDRCRIERAFGTPVRTVWSHICGNLPPAVTFAEQRDLPLVTADARLIRRLSDDAALGRRMVWVGDLATPPSTAAPAASSIAGTPG